MEFDRYNGCTAVLRSRRVDVNQKCFCHSVSVFVLGTESDILLLPILHTAL